MKWQLHGSAVLVPLAALGDNWEGVRGRCKGGFSWCMVAAPPGSRPDLARQRLLPGTNPPTPSARLVWVCSMFPVTGCLPCSTKPPRYPSTTQVKRAGFLAALHLLWQSGNCEGVARGCAAPVAIPTCPLCSQRCSLRCSLRCHQCSSVCILLPCPPPQDGSAEWWVELAATVRTGGGQQQGKPCSLCSPSSWPES